MTAVLPSGTATAHSLIEGHIAQASAFVGLLSMSFPYWIERSELQAVGRLALVESAMRFDDSRGVPFWGFAKIRIAGALVDYLRSLDHVSRGARERATAEEAARTSEHLGVLELQAARPLSLNALSDTKSTLLDTFFAPGDAEPEACALYGADLATVGAAVRQLPAHLRYVLVQYYLAERKLLDIAEELGLTESRISQLRKEAVRAVAVLLGVPGATSTPSDNEKRRRRRRRRAVELGGSDDDDDRAQPRHQSVRPVRPR